jgi:hypothetical protein
MMKKLVFIFCFIFCITSLVFAQGSMYEEPGANIISGRTAVSAANTATVLGSDTRILSVSITWWSKNSSAYVYVGSSTLSKNDGIIDNGVILTSGAILTLNVNNLNKVYISSPSANDSVTYIAVLR